MTTAETPVAQQPQAAPGSRGFSLPPWWEKALFPIIIGLAAIFPFFVDSGGGMLNTATLVLAYEDRFTEQL